MTVLSVQRLPLGFRFNPTDEELINHYLKRKINGRNKSDIEVIPEIDVCKCEPWDLPAKSLIQSDDNRWYFFAPKDRKYPNGQRSNRATKAGYWKATGKDRQIRAKGSGSKNAVVGMKKTLVFHRGRAPKGTRTFWIMHEYRTTEPEFESGEQGGYVLYLLFKKSDENCSSSNAEEIDAGGSPPAPSKSSLSDTHNETDVTEEAENSLNHESPKSFMQEDPEASIVNQSDCFRKWLDETNGHLTSYPANRCPNLSVDGCEAKTEEKVDPLQDILTQISDFDYEQPDNSTFPNISSPMLPYSDHPFLTSNNQGSHVGLFPEDNAEWGSLDDLINLEMFGDMSPSGTYIQEDSINANELVNGIWDSAICKHSMSCDIDAESEFALLLLQCDADMESHDLSYGMPSLPTRSYQMDMDTSVRYPVQKPQLSSLYQDLSPLPTDSIAPDVYSVGSVSESLQDLLSNSNESCYQKNTAANGEDAIIEIRGRRSQHPPNPDDDLVQQGIARRRIRLRGSINSSTIKEKETGSITWETKQHEELNKLLANEAGTSQEPLSTANTESGCGDKYKDEEEIEHVDDNLTETEDASWPLQVDKSMQPKIYDEVPVSSDVHQDHKPELRMRKKSDLGDLTDKVSSLPLIRPRKSKIFAYVIWWVLLAVLLVVICGGIYIIVV